MPPPAEETDAAVVRSAEQHASGSPPELNGQTLPVEHGAPIRLRLERQLGYKMAKYVMRIELVESFESISGGNGGYWENQGYEWYPGI